MTHSTLGRRPAVAAVAVAVSLLAAAPSILAHQAHSDAESAPPEAANETAPPAQGQQPEASERPEAMHMPGMLNMRMPEMDPEKGRKLFVSKGCVACHAINGVGGHDATPLDAHTMKPMMNPFDFAAKMWRMAPAMIHAQEEALGAQILFTGDELANIVAFVHDDEAQHRFTEADLTPEARRLMRHSHGSESGVDAHADELGHHHDEEPEGHGMMDETGH